MQTQGAGRGWFSEWLDERVLVTYVDRNLTVQSFDEFLQWLDRDIRLWPADQPRAVFYEVPTRSDFGPKFRKALAEVLNRHKEKLKLCTAGYALVTSSAIIRGVLTATFWIAPPGYPTHVCKTPEEAFQWLAQCLEPAPDSEAVERWVASYTHLRRRIDLSESA